MALLQVLNKQTKYIFIIDIFHYLHFMLLYLHSFLVIQIYISDKNTVHLTRWKQINPSLVIYAGKPSITDIIIHTRIHTV